MPGARVIFLWLTLLVLLVLSELLNVIELLSRVNPMSPGRGKFRLLAPAPLANSIAKLISSI